MTAKLIDETCGAKVGRGVVIEIEAFDWNCSQHITERFTLAEIEPTISALKARIAELEEQMAVIK